MALEIVFSFALHELLLRSLQPLEFHKDQGFLHKKLKRLFVFKDRFIICMHGNGFLNGLPCAYYIEKVFAFYKNYDQAYFKFIIENGFDLHQIKQLLKKYDYHKTVWLQPEYSNAVEITNLILNKHLDFDYKISGQLHNYLGVR